MTGVLSASDDDVIMTASFSMISAVQLGRATVTMIV